MKTRYDETYYERGIEMGVSGYSNYRWLPELTIPMCKSIVNYLGLDCGSRVLDFGCAKGFVVKALRELGIDAWGVDVSEYAISHADPKTAPYLKLLTEENDCSYHTFDWVISKDVFEHIPYDQLDNVLGKLSNYCNKLFCVVPLGQDGKFVIPDYENDVTHIIRENKEWWVEKVKNNGFDVMFTEFRVTGIKDNWAHYPFGNLFLIAKSKNL